MNDMVTRAYEIAAIAHARQFRFDGKTPYIEHPWRVMSRLVENGYGTEYQAVALLHDVLEDTDVTAKDLLDKEIPENIVYAVIILTKEDGVDYGVYLDKVRNNELARVVKIADMIDNLSDKPSKKQIIKYATGLLTLVED